MMVTAMGRTPMMIAMVIPHMAETAMATMMVTVMVVTAMIVAAMGRTHMVEIAMM
jgi:hypothetical protein